MNKQDLLRASLRYLINRISNRPLFLSLLATEACNAGCDFCHFNRYNKLKVRETKGANSYLHIYKELNPIVLSIAGGEPTLRSDLENIVYEAKHIARIPVVQITTNGSQLSINGMTLFERYLSLSSAGLDILCISLDIPNKKHNESRKIKELYEQIEQFLAQAQAYASSLRRAHINLNTIILPEFFPDNILGVIELAKQYGTTLAILPYSPVPSNTEQRLSEEQIGEFEKIVDDLILNHLGILYHPPMYLEKVIPFLRYGSTGDKCHATNYFIWKRPDYGTYFMCDQIPNSLGSFNKTRLKSKENYCDFCARPCRVIPELAASDVFTVLRLGLQLLQLRYV